METILQGWLTKSPPEKKQFKLFGSKWRKRYFVLYAPPTADNILNTCQAMLEYYSNKKLQHKCGKINLAACEEVLSNLDSETYKHVFGLRTIHKNSMRTYYLAADTEAEMNKWVNKLCQVLGLTENDDAFASPSSQQHHHMVVQNGRMTAQPMRIVSEMRHPLQRPLAHQSPALLSPAPPPMRPGPLTPFSRLNISEPNLLDVTSPKSYPESRHETAEVGWQMASAPGTSRIASPPGAPRIRNAESFPELDRFSPTMRKPGNVSGEGREFMELPPIPPEKTGHKIVPEPEGDMDYDHPKQKYYEREETAKKEKSTDCDSALIPLFCVHG